MSTSNKTTPADFERFIEYVRFWQRELGLDDWDVYVLHGPTQGCYAQTHALTVGRAATIILAKVWKDCPVTDEELRGTALHEVMHVATAQLRIEAKYRYTNEAALDEAEHALVVRLTNYIMRTHKEVKI